MSDGLRPGLLALDLDGTLIGRSLDVREPVVRAVRQAVDLGIAVTLVTGRMFAAARPIAERLGIGGPIACYQGAAIFDVASGRIEAEFPLPHAVAMRVYERARRDGYHVQMYAADRFYVEALNRYSALYARISGTAPIVVDSLAVAFAGRDTTKLNIVTEPERTEACAAMIAEIAGGEAYVTRSNPEFVEVINKDANKGRALATIAAQLGVERARIVAVGDSYNDVPLLQAAGFGVAMASAPPELKAVADAVVGDVDHDGAAEAIGRFVLREVAS